MIVVSNASPILNLVAIGQGGLLHSLFPSLIVPAEVAAEISQLRESRSRFRSVRLPEFLEIRKLHCAHVKTALATELDVGEAAAIALAVALDAGLLLIDELRGRGVARRFGFSTLGVLGALKLARRRGLIPAIAPGLCKLEEQAGFWVGATLRAQVLREDRGIRLQRNGSQMTSAGGESTLRAVISRTHDASSSRQ